MRVRLLWFVLGLIVASGAWAFVAFRPGPPPPPEVEQVIDQVRDQGFADLDPTSQDRLRDEVPDVPDPVRVEVVVEGTVGFEDLGPPEPAARIAEAGPADLGTCPIGDQTSDGAFDDPGATWGFYGLRSGDLSGTCRAEVAEAEGRTFVRQFWTGQARQWSLADASPSIVSRGPIRVEDQPIALGAKPEAQGRRQAIFAAGVLAPDLGLWGRATYLGGRWTLEAEAQTIDLDLAAYQDFPAWSESGFAWRVQASRKMARRWVPNMVGFRSSPGQDGQVLIGWTFRTK